VIVEILAATANAPTTQMDLTSWIDAYMLPVTSVRDPSGIPTLTALYRREYSYIVDLSTMKITNIYIGSTNGTGTPSVTIAMQDMLKALGASD